MNNEYLPDNIIDVHYPQTKIELPVGSYLRYNKEIFKVVEDFDPYSTCKDLCDFSYFEHICCMSNCSEGERKDKLNVSFVLVDSEVEE